MCFWPSVLWLEEESLALSATVLVLWVGIGALLRGISQMFLAFECEHVHREAKSNGDSTAPFGAHEHVSTGNAADEGRSTPLHQPTVGRALDLAVEDGG
jgi:hypothetical protein